MRRTVPELPSTIRRLALKSNIAYSEDSLLLGCQAKEGLSYGADKNGICTALLGTFSGPST